MNVRNMTAAFAIALAVSGVCTYALSRKMTAKAAEHVDVLRYVGPAKPLQAGEVLKPENLSYVSWPANNPIPGAFTKPEDLAARSALYPIDKGQPITDKMVSTPGAGFGLSARIPQGMRAIALRTDEVMGVAGFLLPGSHVDVLATYRSDRSPEPETATILQNAEVLTAGHQVQPDPEGKPATVTVVTLLLSPADAEKAVLATTQGSLHFVLRSGSDQTTTANSPAVMSQVMSLMMPSEQSGPIRMMEHAPRVKPVSHQNEMVVETVMGDKQISQTFKVDRP